MRTPRPRAARRPPFGLARLFARDQRGATAVEFGIIAVPFLAILCAIFEIAYVNFENEMLSSVVQKAGRAMLTGNMQGLTGSNAVTTSNQFVSKYLCPTTGRKLPNNVDCSKLVVDVRPVSSFTGADLSHAFYKSSTNKFCPGAPGQIVVLRVAYPLGSIFPLNLFSRNVGVVNDVPNVSGWYHILAATALFQEENYSGSYTAPSGC